MKVSVLASFARRLRGLLPGSLARDSSYAVFIPCRDIHTFGMDCPIDVAFADQEGCVLASHRRVEPGRRVRCVSAKVAVERIAADGPWFEVGDNVFADMERSDCE